MATIRFGWASLEKRSAPIFLLAGILFLVATVIGAVGAYTPVNTESEFMLFLEGIGRFGGVVLSYVALMSVYPRLRDQTPRLARAGIWLVAIPAIFFLLLLVWEVLAFLLGLFSLTATIPRLDIVTGIVFLLIAVGAGLFGVGYLRSPGLSQAVGYLLFLFAAAWLVFLVAIPLYGFPIPPGISLIQGLTASMALLGIGYLLEG